MRDYLNKFGKRSASIDAGINETQVTSTDPWRIFSNFTEFKGKLTKTVEEKISEIKSKGNDNENSPKFTKANSKDNLSVSDSEEHSECSVPKSTNLSSTAEDIEMSSDDEHSVENDKTPTAPKMTTFKSEVSSPELKNRRKPNVLISYKKDQEEIQLKNISPEREVKHEDDIESGIEACEDDTVDNEINSSTIILHAPEGFVDLRPRIRKIPKKSSIRKYIIPFLVALIFIFLYYFPTFMIGFIFGLILTTGFFLVFYNYISKKNDEDGELESPDEQAMPILEIPAIKEYQPVNKFEVNKNNEMITFC